MLKRLRRKPAKPSGLEHKVTEWLDERGISYQQHKAISRIHPDLLFHQTQTIVEVNGCFWHSCPKCYPDGNEHRKQIAKDKRRYTFLYRQGYKVLVLWEHDILKNWKEVAGKLLVASGTAYEPTPKAPRPV